MELSLAIHYAFQAAQLAVLVYAAVRLRRLCQLTQDALSETGVSLPAGDELNGAAGPAGDTSVQIAEDDWIWSSRRDQPPT